MKRIYYLLPVLLISSCLNKETAMKNYLALGDSYTICESVDSVDRWPIMLVHQLRTMDVDIKDPQIIAKTGWTTDELMEAMDTAILHEEYDMVSLLIGVNNQYRGRDTSDYKNELNELLNRSVVLAGNDPEKVFAISIPDWGVTPFAANRDVDQISIEIDHFNRIKKVECAKRGINYIDITDISRKALENKELIASDGLHPSKAMYDLWLERIIPLAFEISKK